MEEGEWSFQQALLLARVYGRGGVVISTATILLHISHFVYVCVLGCSKASFVSIVGSLRKNISRHPHQLVA